MAKKDPYSGNLFKSREVHNLPVPFFRPFSCPPGWQHFLGASISLKYRFRQSHAQFFQPRPSRLLMSSMIFMMMGQQTEIRLPGMDSSKTSVFSPIILNRGLGVLSSLQQMEPYLKRPLKLATIRFLTRSWLPLPMAAL